ncbi:tyrosine--tRNA ligase [Candidatus Omnitrophota bacterium]
MSIDKALELIRRGTVEIIEETGLSEKLKESKKNGKPLIVKAGFDPSAPDIHLGHTVLLRKLKHFQELGHKVVFLIGDFTAMIGDPTGRSEIRNRLSVDEVRENAKTYKSQVSKILDIKKCDVVFNSKWLKSMSLESFLDLASRQTVARVLERADFYARYKQGKDISLLEFIYPLLQAYDSVVLKADVELGGTDQKFNLLMGRTIQRRFDQPEQTVITMPLLEGTDGVAKMSKSYNNYIGITDSSVDMFGKIMSVSDVLMWRYYELLTDVSLEEISDMRDNMHPMEAKTKLAKEIIQIYHSPKEAEDAQKEFDKVFCKRDLPTEIPVLQDSHLEDETWICALLTRIGLTRSNSEARRLIKDNAVSIDGVKVSDENFIFKKKNYKTNETIFKVGKRRFLRIKW